MGGIIVPPYIHPTAEVEPGAQLGSGVKIWNHAHVRGGASIGTGTNIGLGVFVDSDVVIGSGCKIQNHVSIPRGVTIGDEVFIGPGVVFTNDRRPRAFGSWDVEVTEVRRMASIGAGSTVLPGLVIEEGTMIGAASLLTRSTQPYELVFGSPAHHHGYVCPQGRRLQCDPSTGRYTCACCDFQILFGEALIPVGRPRG